MSVKGAELKNNLEVLIMCTNQRLLQSTSLDLDWWEQYQIPEEALDRENALLNEPNWWEQYEIPQEAFDRENTLLNEQEYDNLLAGTFDYGDCPADG